MHGKTVTQPPGFDQAIDLPMDLDWIRKRIQKAWPASFRHFRGFTALYSGSPGAFEIPGTLCRNGDVH